MAKTIDKMSVEYASAFMKDVDKLNDEQRRWLKRHPEETPPPGGIKACFIFQRSAYLAGANAVLSEIEQAIKDCDVDGSPYAAVLDRIKQLKGESVW